GIVKIKNSVFYKNTANYGGAIYNNSNELLIDSCVFIENSAVHGGAIRMRKTGATISNCRFFDNYASTDGGAIKIVSNSSVKVYSSIFKGNRAKSSGGAVYVQDQAAIFFINNLVVANTGFNGAGIACVEASPYIINNTIYGNSASGHGGGIHMDVSSPKIYNTIVSENAAGYNGNDLYEDNGNPRIENSLIGVEVNFTDAEKEDFSLSPLSSAIDSGRDTAWLRLPKLDLAGNPRVSGGRIDIGAYEYQDGTNVAMDWQSPRTWWAERKGDVITFRVSEQKGANLLLKIYDVSGKQAALLSPVVKAGELMYQWPLTSKSGEIKPGMYILHMQDNNQTLLRGSVVVR
ncbi:MAG: right-handed parallel beta-helix repeat-containing protein, partial [Magnetococcales bacterium]|nr:right-handed parallel beta-helix repeat-containing protein [Magnetococcales bacterium]